MVFVYVPRSREKNVRYIGIAAKLGQRLRPHARGTSKGGQQRGKFELIHREEFSFYADARIRGKYLKSGQGREWLDEQFGRQSTAEQR